MYLNCEAEIMVIGADFTSRFGNLSEILIDSDNFPCRVVLDNTINQHGRDFIDFLIEARFLTLNGRYAQDDFTSISRKGKAVVDYQCVSHENFIN